MKYFVYILIIVLSFILILPSMVLSQNCESLTESECITANECIWTNREGCLDYVPGGGGGGTGGGGGGGGGTGGSLKLTNPIQSSTFAEVMARVADIAAKIGLPLVVVFIIYAGFLFVSARGDEEKLTKAKTTFFWAVIGALLVVGAFAISTAIENFAKQL